MARTNPYSPPRLERARRRTASPSARALEGLLVATAGLSAFRAALYLQALLRWDVLSGTWVEKASRESWFLSLALLAATLVAYSFWVYRTHQAVRGRIGERLLFTPAWSVAVSFVPFVNLVGPYRAVEELGAAVASGGRISVRLWWGLWIASLSWSLASRFGSSDLVAVWRAPVHDGLWAASALALLVAVRSIEAGLERASVTGDPGLPAERFAHRRAS